ncbi:MAG: DinB family protein [Bosea sp. (in: a-proteobacteria)]
MISIDHTRLMAHYNRWQNDSLYREAEALGDAARQQARGAFFGSIHGTLSHLMWGDSSWMHRFDGLEKPPGSIADSAALYAVWPQMVDARTKLDAIIIAWAGRVSEAWLADRTTWYSGSQGKDVTRPNWMLVTHFFNHQTHHRGQVHAMVTAAGGKPDATDVIFMDRLPEA